MTGAFKFGGKKKEQGFGTKKLWIPEKIGLNNIQIIQIAKQIDLYRIKHGDLPAIPSCCKVFFVFREAKILFFLISLLQCYNVRLYKYEKKIN